MPNEDAPSAPTDSQWVNGLEQPPKHRPWWCQDPSCTPDCSDVGAQLGSFDKQPEMSGFCSGRVPAPISFERHGLTHVNDGHFCFRSAIRGVVMLEVNEGDLQILAHTAMHSLVRRGQTKFNLRWYTGPIPEESSDG